MLPEEYKETMRQHYTGVSRTEKSRLLGARPRNTVGECLGV